MPRSSTSNSRTTRSTKRQTPITPKPTLRPRRDNHSIAPLPAVTIDNQQYRTTSLTSTASAVERSVEYVSHHLGFLLPAWESLYSHMLSADTIHGRKYWSEMQEDLQKRIDDALTFISNNSPVPANPEVVSYVELVTKLYEHRKDTALHVRLSTPRSNPSMLTQASVPARAETPKQNEVQQE
jgi:hypothetical protein